MNNNLFDAFQGVNSLEFLEDDWEAHTQSLCVIQQEFTTSY